MSDIVDRLSVALGDRYHVERELGAGGMATVYLTEDLKHKRKVALKVLKPELAAVLGAERFVQEITTTASLQHPHILPLFDSGEADGFLYYVMPYIEGETLRDKLDRETQLSIDEAVQLTTNVADALDYAHRQGVIHRDIKPENVLLHDGRPMVADFGIALAVSAAAGGRMTETGMSLGTPHYMSPEQATAEKDITARSDVYSLGSVLYEMLTGEPPHTGASAQQIIMKIVTEPADPVTKIRKSVPPHIADATAKSLEKLAADRFESAATFAQALKNPAFSRSSPHTGAVPARAARAGNRVSIASTVLAAVFLLVAMWGWLRPSPDSERTVHRQRIELGPDAPSPGWVGFRSAIAPDGSAIAYIGEPSEPGIWIKERTRVDAVLLPGTEEATGISFSQDGVWLSFRTPNGLRKISRVGDASVAVTDSGGGIGPNHAWLEDGSIVFTTTEFRRLYRVDPVGGDLEVVAESGTDSLPFGIVMVQPVWGKNAVLLWTASSVAGLDQVWVLDLSTGEMRQLLAGVSAAWSLPSGHLIYGRQDGAVFVAPFDTRSLEMTGPGMPLVDGLTSLYAVPDLQVAPSGTAIYRRGSYTSTAGVIEPVWIDRQGESRLLPAEPEWASPLNGGLAISPDGQRLAFDAVGEDGRTDVWIRPLTGQQPAMRLTFDGEWNRRPTWTPDGESVVFLSPRGDGPESVWIRRADGREQARPLLTRALRIFEALISPDGYWLVYRTDDEGTAGRGDILAVRLGSDSVEIELAASEAEETSPALSPDGRWLAYASAVSGRKEIYVVPFPDVRGGGPWQVSTSGGIEPVWSRSGRELFYRSGAGRLIAAEIVTEQGFAQVNQRELTEVFVHASNDDHRMYGVAPDDQAFLFLRPLVLRGGESDLVLVENWLEEVKRLVGN